MLDILSSTAQPGRQGDEIAESSVPISVARDHRLSRIDHLRAIAAFMVIAWHATPSWSHDIAPGFRFLSVLKEGHAGVSLFCVISGFILTTIYLGREHNSLSFYKSRLLRIAPLFLFVVFLTYYVSEWDATSLLTASLTGLVRGGLPSYAGPGWTVLVECQFYLLFPFLLIFAKRYGIKYPLGLLLMLLLVRAAVWNATGTVQQVSYYSIFGRMDQFLIGMAAAIALSDARIRAAINLPSRATLTFLAGVASAIAFFWWFKGRGGLLNYDGQVWPNKSSIWICMPSIEGGIFVLIVCGYLHLPSLPYTTNLSKAVSYVGVVSYSIYLLHVLLLQPILQLIAALGIVPSSWEQSLLLVALIVMPILVAAASISYFVIELPFMQLRDSARRQRSSIQVNPSNSPSIEQSPQIHKAA